MRIPRSLSAKKIIKYLNKIGYTETRQRGSHIRLSRAVENSTHHLTIPDHDPVKVGTLKQHF